MDPSVSPSGLMEVSTSTPSLGEPSNLLHPVSNKSIPKTAIAVKHVTRVTTPGSYPDADSPDADSPDSDSSDAASPDNMISTAKQATFSHVSQSVSGVEDSSPRTYMTKKRRMESKVKKIQNAKQTYQKACVEYQQGKFDSIYAASQHYGLSYTSLHRYLVYGDSYNGKGRKSKVLTAEEEQKIVDHVIYRQKIGCGMTYLQLQLLIQEVLVAVTSSNPERSSPYADNGHFPNRFFARKLAVRNNLTLRATMEISKGRQILSVDDLVAWQRDTEAGLVNNEVVADCFNDGARIFNQDETSVQVGSGSGKVLAEKGTKVLYNFSGSSRDHVTASFTVSASGGCVPVRTIFKGVRNMAAQHLKDLPTNGKSGSWKFGVTANGYVTREAFMDILKDLDEYLEEKNIRRPVILFMDGQKGHISLEAAAYSKLKHIQPWLLRANMTHLLQALDLTFFNSLKKKLNELAHHWHADPKNADRALSKYSVMWVLHETTEICLANPSLIPNGFKRAGLLPWNPSAPDRTKLLPGTVYARSMDTMDAPTPTAQTSNTMDTADVAELSQVSQGFIEVTPTVQQLTPDSTPQLSEMPSDEDTVDNTDFEPPLSSTFREVSDGPEDSIRPYWYGKTQMCRKCNRRILN